MEIIAHHRSPRPAHRGAVLAALQTAIDAEADRVEIDVLSHPSGLVVAHDARVMRGARGLGLAEALDLVADSPRALHVDLKSDDAARDLGEALAARALGPRTIVCGERLGPVLDAARLAGARAAWTLPAPAGGHPDARSGPLGWAGRRARGRVRVAAEWALGDGGCAVLCVEHRHVDASLVESVHARAGTLFAWTADRPRQLERLAALGVDGLITNQPAAAARIRAAVLARS